MKNMRKLWDSPMKVMRGILGAAVFSVAMLLFSFESFAAEGTVKPASAKIRESADTTSSVLASVESGDELTIKAKTTGTDGNVWYQVFVDANTLGFIRSDLLEADGDVAALEVSASQPEEVENTAAQAPAETPVQPADTNVESMPRQSAAITGGDVNVRAGAGTSTAKVATAKNGTAVTVTEIGRAHV